MKTIIENRSFDQERSLYGTRDALIRNCHFGGPVDGESALKESSSFTVEDCTFGMRYVFWHIDDFVLQRLDINELTRAGLWYGQNGKILDSVVHGPKFLRECKNIEFARCDISSDEFGWKCESITVSDGKFASVYPFLMSKNLRIRNLEINAKYSFQYVTDSVIENCQFITKDAFWHAENVVVRNCTIESEYLGWYSKNLTLVNCHIKGTQPFCYCQNLTLENCTMEDCDLSFEYSSVNATIVGRVESIKNPLSGTIRADEVGSIIREGSVKDCRGRIYVGGEEK